MQRLTLRHLLVCSLLSVSIAIAPAQTPPSPGDSGVPRSGVVLLQNGQVISGEIARTGDYYSILVDHGEIRLHAREVEHVSGSLSEVYRYLKARSRFDNAGDRLDLAVWCTRFGLMREAAAELQQAAALNPAHPLIPLVDRRIRMAFQPPSQQSNRQLADEPADTGPTPEELDRFVRGMPDGVVEMFAQTVQPLLTNHCTASGCHGPSGDQSFSLLRIPANQPPSRRLTQRNLHAAVQQVDRNDVENSPLLTAPLRAHGSARAAIFIDRYSSQYQQLIAWAYLVAQGDPPAVAESPAVLPATHMESQAETVTAQQAAYIEPAASSPPSPFGASSAIESAPAIKSNIPPLQADQAAPPKQAASSVKRGGMPPEFVPADPFDPAIFNRRFFPSSAKEPAER